MFSLLLVHQAFWLFMRSPQWAAAAGSPSGIYIQELSPERRLLNSWISPSAPIEMEDRNLVLSANAPQGTRTELLLNGIRLEEAGSIATATLRRGTNIISVFAQNESTYRHTSLRVVPFWFYLGNKLTFIPENMALALLHVRSQNPLGIKAISAKSSDACYILGFAEPGSSVFIRDLEQIDEVRTQVSGEFRTRLFGDISQPRTLEFSYSNDRNFRASERLTIPAGCSSSADQQIALQHEVRIQHTADKTRISFSGHIPEGTALQEWVDQEQITPPEILRYLTGVTVAEVPDSESTIAHTKDVTGDHIEFEMSIPARSPIYGENSFQTLPILLSPEDKLEVDDSFKMALARPTTEGGKGTKIWRGGNPSDLASFSFFLTDGVDSSSMDKPNDEENGEARPSIGAGDEGSALSRFESHIPNFVRQILQALMTALPFLWLLVLLQRMRRDSPDRFPKYGRILYGATATFLLFHLTVLILPLFSFSLNFFNVFFSIGQWFGSKGINAQNYVSAFALALSRLGRMYPFLMIGVSLLIRPLFVTYSTNTLGADEESLAVRIFRWLLFWPMVILLSLLSVAMITVYFAATATFPGQDELSKAFLAHYLVIQLCYISVAFAIFWLFLYWPFRVSLRLRVGIRPVLLATLAMLTVPIAAPLLDLVVRITRHQIMIRYQYYASFISIDFPQFLATGVFALIVAFLLDQIAYVAVHLTRGRGLRFIHSRWRWLALAGYFLLALPLTAVSQSLNWSDDTSGLRFLALHIDDLLPYILALGIVRFLQHINTQDSFAFRRNETYSIGALLFAFYLTGRTADILFIPLPVLLGWWLFRYVVIKVKESAVPTSTQAVKSDDVIALVEYRRTLPLVQDLRDTVEGKLKKAEISVADYQVKMREADGLLNEARDKLRDSEEGIRNRIFGLGPESGPWKNGITAVKAGIVLSAPFQILNLLQNAIRAGDPYFQFQWISSILFSFSFWTISAFLFGYFFHTLRGRDGLEKGLVFCLAVVLPTIPQRLLGGEPLFRSAHLAQIFEILAFMLALGLLFDLRSLRQLKSRWNDLVAIHGFKRITGYASSVVITTIAGLAGPALKTVLVGLLGKIGLKMPMGGS